MDPKNIDRWIKNGVFFALFVSLLVWTVNENKQRELKYQETVAKLTDIVKIDLVEIKSKLK